MGRSIQGCPPHAACQEDQWQIETGTNGKQRRIPYLFSITTWPLPISSYRWQAGSSTSPTTMTTGIRLELYLYCQWETQNTPSTSRCETERILLSSITVACSNPRSM